MTPHFIVIVIITIILVNITWDELATNISSCSHINTFIAVIIIDISQLSLSIQVECQLESNFEICYINVRNSTVKLGC